MKPNFDENTPLQFAESTYKSSVITVSKAFVIGPQNTLLIEAKEDNIPF